MKIPWKLPQCNYPGCNYKIWKRNEIHCKKHHEEVLKKLGRIQLKREEGRKG